MQSQKQPLTTMFSAASRNIFCNGPLIWDKQKAPQKYLKIVCLIKVLLDFTVSNILFKELYWNNGFS